MPETKRSEVEVHLSHRRYNVKKLAFQGFFVHVLVHRNARMTEMKRSGIEVIPAFADNVRE